MGWSGSTRGVPLQRWLVQLVLVRVRVPVPVLVHVQVQELVQVQEQARRPQLGLGDFLLDTTSRHLTVTLLPPLICRVGLLRLAAQCGNLSLRLVLCPFLHCGLGASRMPVRWGRVLPFRLSARI